MLVKSLNQPDVAGRIVLDYCKGCVAKPEARSAEVHLGYDAQYDVEHSI